MAIATAQLALRGPTPNYRVGIEAIQQIKIGKLESERTARRQRNPNLD
jgi:hypothetical protein